MTKTKQIKWMFLVLISLVALVDSASATLNITVQSANLKDISLIKISDFSTTAIIGNNQSANIPYDNYILQFGANVSSISYSNFFGNITKMQSDGLIIALIFLIIILTVIFVRGLNN
jgi:hypothetical protein